MEPGGSGGRGSGGSSSGKGKKDTSEYIYVSDAKDLLDRIGEKVYEEKVKNGDAKKYIEALKGNLNTANGRSSETASSIETCTLVKEYYERVNGDGKRHPCRKDAKNEDVNRFSDTLGGQCTYNRIKDSQQGDNKVGACAPYRRLHVCVRNLENINDTDKRSTHKLLGEVCMAAYYEGQSIKDDYVKYQTENTDFNTTICTELARSFADIGDIIRGKDLFRGYNEKDRAQKKKIQDNLKDIFKKIHDDVTSSGRNGEIEKRYGSDKENYYQLREDWWALNRNDVWKAITCNAQGFNYFRHTCNGGERTKGYCRCSDKPNTDPPTYFDYVPQYLRWFEEWAEDFCRKRKHKLKDVIEKCRGENGSERYCSGNGFDCKETVRGDEHFVEKDCHDCSYSCSPFVKWIDNQKKEFLKQKRKYETEISGGGSGKSPKRTKRAARSSSSSDDNGYESKFYKKLKEVGYQDVDKFLKILNKEGICQKQPQVGNEKADNVDFTNEKYVKTFSRTEICEPCPWCGLEKGGPPWKVKGDKTCGSAKTKTYDPKNITDIPVLYPDKSQQNILKKYKNFCEKGAPGGGQIKKWQCYYDEHKPSSKNNNNCVEGTWDKFTQGKQTVKSYNVFFWDWVHDMLHDSVEWKTELSKCINNNTNGNTCRNNNKCKTDCGCFQKWVEKKQQEWMAIKDHFGKQTDIVQQKGLIVFSPYGVLDLVLKGGNLLQNIKDVHGDTDDIKHIKKLLDEEDAVAVVLGGKDNTTIDKLLQHEKEQAEQCKQKQEECEKKAQQESRGRSAETREDERTQQPADSAGEVEEEEDDDDYDEDDEDDDVVQEEEEEKEEGTVAEVTEVTEVVEETVTEQEGVKPCDIVDKLFEDDKSLKEACGLKYGPGGKEKFPNWKCVTPSGVSTATSGKDGAICVPPRRRRLYVGGLSQWASRGGDETTEVSSEATSAPSQSESEKLRTAFIESAAIETFFLWHKYKEEKKPPATQDGAGLGVSLPEPSPPGEDPQTQLQQTGVIPPDFLRQMFYTLADYKDILYSGSNDTSDTTGKQTPSSSNDNLKNIVLEASGSTEQEKEKMKQIQAKIKKILNGATSGVPPVTKNSVKTPQQTWWENIAKDIWNAMVCALTYKENDARGTSAKIEQNKDLKKALWDEANKNTPIEKYQYTNVKLEDESGAKSNDTIQPPTLKNFVEIPTFFRWLHEWGNSFCFERAKRLAQIKHECMDEDGEKQYSGDGEYCEEIFSKQYNVLQDLSSSCAKPCRLYKTWIEKKKTEYEKQQKAYEQQKSNYENEQKDKCQTQSNNNANEFSRTLGASPTAAEFLQKLGSCKNDNGYENGEDNKIDFKNPDKTFKEAHSCDPCPITGVKCQNGHCVGSANGKECKNNKITAEDIKNKTDPNGNIEMVVSDDSTNTFEHLGDCKSSGIFKGIRKDEWKCANVCGVDICTLEKKIKNGQEGDKKYITMKELLKRWLEYFLEDYNRIRKKIKLCTKKEDGCKCIKGCIEKWVQEKTKEWQKINDTYLEQYKNDDGNTLTNFLEQFQYRTEFKNAIKPCDGLDQFKTSCGLNSTDNSQNGNNNDLVLCLLNKLQKKISECKEQHSGQTQTPCDNSSLSGKESTLVEDVDDYEEQNPENKVEQPKFCPDMKEPKKENDEEVGTCGGDEEKKKVEDSVIEQKEEEAASAPEESPPLTPEAPKKEENVVPKPPPPPKKRRIKTRNVLDHPAVIPALMSSTIMWSIGIGFAAFTYFYLKKKMKKRKKKIY
ncbi:hypothetical protein PFDG_01745 [Plasmodium falciparum Dd2]|uniref:Erythrocyte membrane protein 1 n=2 Tax=Plasmodium falciparum TaxID=5833 RepID=A0A0L7M673_PLAF4|nr:hypothetical protein PFDG_01745 [Plasmodium falciparum Dd2]